MKKIFALLLCMALLLSLAACGAKDITMQEILDANQTETLLKTYDSLHYRHSENGEFYEEYYLTKDYTYENYGSWSMYLAENTGYYHMDGVYNHFAYITPDGFVNNREDRKDYFASFALGAESVMETIQSITKADGRITVATTMPKEAILEMIDEDDNLESMESEYVLDSKTHGVITNKGIYTYTDGTIVEILDECSYNTEAPEVLKTILEYEQQTENLRTVTVVFNAGTEQEKTECIRTPQGIGVGLAPYDPEASYTLYLDAAFTEVYPETSDSSEDVTLYVKWDS